MILLSNEQFCGLPSSSLFKAPGLNGKVRLRWCRPEAHALKPSQDHWLRSVPLLSEKPRSLPLHQTDPSTRQWVLCPQAASLWGQACTSQCRPGSYRSFLGWRPSMSPHCWAGIWWVHLPVLLPHLTLLSRLQRTSKWNLIKSPVKSLTVSTLVTLFFRNWYCRDWSLSKY